MNRDRSPLRVLAPFGAGALMAAAASLRPRVGLLVVGASAAIAVSALTPLFGLAAALIISCQLTGGRFTFAGYNFLPEHVVVLVFAAALLIRQTAWFIRRATAFEMLLLAWIAWSGAVSVFYAVKPGESMAIVAWMALAWLILWCMRSYLVAAPERRARMLNIGASVAAWLGAGAFAIWALALLGGPEWLVQPDYVTGQIASKGLAFEANFLGSQELFWLFIVIRRRMLNEAPVSPWQVTGMVLGIVASMTRAVWLAGILMLIGLFLIGKFTALRSRPTSAASPRRSLGQAVVAGMCMSLLLIVLGNPAAQKFRASLDFGTSTGESRVTTWKKAWTDLQVSRSYVIGLGANSFGQRHLSPTLPGEPDYLGNLPLSVLYDSGLIGVALFGGAMMTLIARGRSARARLINAVFVLTLMIVGAATSPIWMGFVWITMAIIDTDPDPPSVAVGGDVVTAGRTPRVKSAL